jgi:hypothetical protein
MKATVELPAPLLRKVKALTAREGISLDEFVAGAVRQRINGRIDNDDEYTPAQRRMIRARLDKAERGPAYGPFKSASEVAAFLKSYIGARKGARVRKTA